MADKKPAKGILKHSSSLDHPHHAGQKEMKWDEMNILATHHPPDKTYGHMKIDEPPTPYNKSSDLEEDDDEGEPSRRRGSWSGPGPVSPAVLASKLEQSRHPKEPDLVVEAEDSEEEEEEMTEEERARRRSFELKRKLHYNEFQAVQLAKKLLAEEDDEDEDEDAAPSTSTGDIEKKTITSDSNNHTSEKDKNVGDLVGAAGAEGTVAEVPSVPDVAMASEPQGERREEPIEVETEI